MLKVSLHSWTNWSTRFGLAIILIRWQPANLIRKRSGCSPEAVSAWPGHASLGRPMLGNASPPRKGTKAVSASLDDRPALALSRAFRTASMLAKTLRISPFQWSGMWSEGCMRNSVHKSSANFS